MKKVKLRILAALLSMILILGCSNFSVTAEDSPDITENLQEDQIEENAETPSEAVTEDESLRDRFTKHYVTENGKRYAVVYAEQVHYEDNNGNWQEVDNSLTFDSSKQKYSTNNTESSVFEASFAPTLTQNGELVSVSDGEYTVSWSLSFAGTGNMQMTMNANASIVNSTEPESKTLSNMGDMGKAVSSVRYNSVYSDTDVRYSLSYGRVEEDIILNSRGGFASYMMTVDTDGLTAVKNADGSIDLSNAEGETVFNIASPWMKDAAGAYSSDIEVELIQRDDTAYVIYAPSAEWLDSPERVYPVLIDPSFTTRYYTSNYKDAYVSSDMPDECYSNENTLWVGFDSLYQYYAYIKILNIPELPSIANIENISFDVYSTPPSTKSLDLYIVLDSWSTDASDTDYLSYNSMPSTELFYQFESGVPYWSSYTKFSFDLSIDDLQYVLDYCNYSNLLEFFNSGYWNGFMIDCSTGDDDSFLEICSSEYSSSYYRPTLTIEYTYNSNSTGLYNNAIYSFKNAASGNYLGVDPSNTDDGANVYQQTLSSSSRAQAFKLLYDETNTYCEIMSVFSGGTLEYNYYSSTNESGYVPQNVNTYWQGADTECQEWIIVPHVDNLYKILSRADPNLAITAVGSTTGTPDGTGTSAAGNIIVSEFTGANNQLWRIRSGNTFVKATELNIIDSHENQSTYSLAIGEYIQFVCPVYNFGDTVTWSVSNIIIAYSSGGIIGALDVGQVTFTATVRDLDGIITETYSTNLTFYLPEGQYFLYNCEYDNYMQIGTESSSTLELWDFDGADDQRWNITYLDNGYYKITSEASGLALSVPNNSVSQDGANIVLKTYTGTNLQQWKITRTSAGIYKIATRSNESLYLAAGEGAFLNGGRNIEQRSDLSNQAEEWIICKFDKSILLAIDHSDNALRYEYFSKTRSNLQTVKNGIVSVTSTVRYSNLSVSQMINYLKNSNIFIVHTHGMQTGFQIANSGKQFLTKRDIVGEDLSNLSVVLLLTCETARDYSQDNITNKTPVNIIEQMVICGAKTVVGFREKTYVSDCNIFAETITEKLIKETLSVEDAINDIDYGGYIINMANIAEIAGDKNNKLR